MKILFPWSYYWLGVALTCVAATGAGAISHMFAGWPGAKHSWIIGFSLALIYAIGSGIIWYKQRDSVRYSFYAAAFMGVVLMLFMLALALPIFYVMPISTVAGAVLLASFIITIVIHQYMAYRYFNEYWDKVGRIAQEKSVKNNKFSMDFFRKKFDPYGAPSIIEFSPYIVSLSFNILLVLSLLVGLSLRKPFPIFSGFAWAIPSMIAVAVIAQAILIQILGAQRLSALEKILGIQLKTDDTL